MAPGGQATPAPPLGPVLGANGVNQGQFITQFNDATRELNGKLVGCVVTVFEDRSFELEIKSSPASTLIMEKAKVKKGSSRLVPKSWAPSALTTATLLAKSSLT